MPTAYLAQTVALSVVALAWGLINFGLLLWMPAHLVAKGYSMAVSSGLLASSAVSGPDRLSSRRANLAT